MRKDLVGSVKEYGINILSFDGREIVEPLEVGYVTATTKGGSSDTSDSVGAYTTSTTWAAGDQDILSGAHFA
jgi:ACT domain-containing protein